MNTKPRCVAHTLTANHAATLTLSVRNTFGAR